MAVVEDDKRTARATKFFYCLLSTAFHLDIAAGVKYNPATVIAL